MGIPHARGSVPSISWIGANRMVGHTLPRQGKPKELGCISPDSGVLYDDLPFEIEISDRHS